MKIIFSSTSAFAAFFVVAVSMTMAACGTREKFGAGSDVDTVQYALATEDSVEKDAPQHLADTIDFDGQHFIISVDRTPSDSLPRVSDEYGPYLDNIVKVKVIADGKMVVNRTFTKNDFRDAGESLPLSRLTLGGMGFTAINGRGIQFNAQICEPGSLEGGHNFKVLFNLSGGNMRVAPDDSAEDHSSDDDTQM